MSFWIMRPVSAIDLSGASDAALAEAGYTTVTVPAGERREIASFRRVGDYKQIHVLL